MSGTAVMTDTPREVGMAHIDMDSFIDSTIEEMQEDELLGLASSVDAERLSEWMRTVWLVAQGKPFGPDVVTDG